MKKSVKIALFILIPIFVIGIGIFVFIQLSTKSLEELGRTTITTPDFSHLEDGDYTGRYSAFPVNVELSVEIQDGKIIAIDITKHDNGQGKDGEKIVDDVIKAQSLEVDVISGATYSSKVILKAIEDALIPDSK